MRRNIPHHRQVETTKTVASQRRVDMSPELAAELKQLRTERRKQALADGTTFESPGRFNFADRQVDPSTGTILMQVSFFNQGNLLRPGQFARLRVIMDEVENGLLIPQRCVREIQGNFMVYTLNASNEVETRQVKLGPKVGSMWLVLEGLKAEDQIIFEGLMYARPGNKVTPKLVEIPKEFIDFK